MGRRRVHDGVSHSASVQYKPGCTRQQAPTVWDSAEGCVVRDVDDNGSIGWTSGLSEMLVARGW